MDIIPVPDSLTEEFKRFLGGIPRPDEEGVPSLYFLIRDGIGRDWYFSGWRRNDDATSTQRPIPVPLAKTSW